MRRIGQFRSPAWAILTCALALGACAEFREATQGAADAMDRMFGVAPTAGTRDRPASDAPYADAGPKVATDSGAAADGMADIEIVYQAALAAKERGAETEALLGFRKAALQGHPHAQFMLGEAYSLGRGVAKNSSLAARWYGKAAHQGVSDAQYAYGLVHVRGLGLPVDRAEGYGWLLLAARNGHERAEVVRRTIEPKLSAPAMQQAKDWAAQFAPTPESRFADRPTVMYVQQTLNTLGYSAGPVDGQPGPRTRVAVGRFQKKAGLARDGEITPALIEILTGY